MDSGPSTESLDDGGGLKIPSWQIAAALGLTVAVLFFPVLTGFRSFFYRDYGVLGYPVIAYGHERFWRGDFFPLWNPLSNCGAPFLAQWGTMSLYPFSLIYLVLPLPWSLGLFCLAHLVLGGLGMRRLAQRFTRHEASAALAGMVYMINGITFSCLIWPNYQVALGWLPWVVALSLAAGEEGGRRVFPAALASAMQLLVGVPELVVLTWLFIATLVLCLQRRQLGSAAGHLLLVVLLASGLIAAQFLPFLELIRHSQRDAAFATDRWAFPVWGIGNFFAPLFHCFKTPEGIFFQPGQEFLNSCYFGLPVLALAGLSLRKPRHSLALPLAILLSVTILFSMGDRARLYAWLREIFPFFGVARFPVKFLLLTIPVTALLAGFGLDHLWRNNWTTPSARTWHYATCAAAVLLVLAGTLWIAETRPMHFDQTRETLGNGGIRALFLAGTSIIICFATLTGNLEKRTGCFVLVWGLLVADVATHVPWQNPILPADDFRGRTWEAATGLKRGLPLTSRAFIPPEAEDRLLRSSITQLEPDFVGKRIALWSNLHLLEEIAKVNGSATLQIQGEAEVQNLIYKEPRHDLPRLLNFLGVAWQSKADKVLEWENRSGAMPLVTAGQEPVFFQDTLAAWSNRFDPARAVVFDVALQSKLGNVHRAEATISGLSIASERIQFECAAPSECVAVIAQSNYPDWRAYCDGRPVEILTANHAFQAVILPAGKHRVEIRYQDEGFVLGSCLSAASLAVCLAGLRRPRNSGSPAAASLPATAPIPESGRRAGF